MQVAVISDVHGNLEALQAVLQDVELCKVEEVVCLGDSVGYGADPEAVVVELRERQVPTVLGNHELGLRDPSMLEWFNPPTMKSLLITRELISARTLEYIEGLKPTLVWREALLVHGSPPDSVTTYLFELGRRELTGILGSMKQQLCFVGHTHQLEIIRFDGTNLDILPLPQGFCVLKPECKYIVNVGSVGQPRDGDNRAKYVLWDPQEGVIQVRFVPYDIASAAAKILERGFPSMNATRLWGDSQGA